MVKRTTEQVHEEDGHATPVASCPRCVVEVDEERTVEDVGADVELSADVPVDEPEPVATEPCAPLTGRPKCYVDTCPLPEFVDDVGLCGGHYATRPDLRKVARRG